MTCLLSSVKAACDPYVASAWNRSLLLSLFHLVGKGAGSMPMVFAGPMDPIGANFSLFISIFHIIGNLSG